MDEFAERLLDMNRTIGQPKKITMIFGRTRRITAYAFSQTCAAKKWPLRGSSGRVLFPAGRAGLSWRPWRLCVKSFLESVDDTGDAVFDEGDVEVDE